MSITEVNHQLIQIISRIQILQKKKPVTIYLSKQEIV
jgi:hypothetical protein